MLQANALQAELTLALVIGPVRGVLGLGLLDAFARAQDRSAGVHPDAVPKSVIAVIVRVEDVADGLAGSLANVSQNGAGAPGKIGVDHQHVVAEDDPARVGDDVLRPVRGAIVHVRSELLREIGLAVGVAQERTGQQQRENRGKRQTFHRYGNSTMWGQPFRLPPGFCPALWPANFPCKWAPAKPDGSPSL